MKATGRIPAPLEGIHVTSMGVSEANAAVLTCHRLNLVIRTA